MVTRYDTQWCAQFYVCAELTRREYLVALTLGNAQETDIFVSSPSGRNFRIDVKGQSTKNFWRFREKSPKDDLYYALVYMPKNFTEHPMFAILTSAELMKERAEYDKKISHKGKEYSRLQGGMNWSRVFDYKDRWNILPK